LVPISFNNGLRTAVVTLVSKVMKDWSENDEKCDHADNGYHKINIFTENSKLKNFMNPGTL
jgi:hypothetical protein